MPSAIGRLALAAILALGALPSAAHGDGAGATPWVQAGTGMGGRAMAPFGHAVAPRAAVIVAPQQRVIVVPQQHTTTTHEHAMMAHGHPVLVVPGTVLVVPQTPVYYV